MKTLYLHAKEFMYRPQQPVKGIPKDEATTEEKKFNNVLVVFITIERGDWDIREEKIQTFIEDLENHMERIDIDGVVIYPYAHLSEELEDPRKAYRFLKYLENSLKKKDMEVHRAPFGWYKEFLIHVHGHPLAELSRRF